MASWGEIISKFNDPKFTIDAMMAEQEEYVRRLTSITNRNIIFYYSAFLQKPGYKETTISDTDINAFMENIYKMDKNKGLDLVLHTPGGDIAATEQIINYLHSILMEI